MGLEAEEGGVFGRGELELEFAVVGQEGARLDEWQGLESLADMGGFLKHQCELELAVRRVSREERLSDIQIADLGLLEESRLADISR